ncbi:MAG: alpha/beta fold hydrolase [Steroidobacteraceae bacterium]
MTPFEPRWPWRHRHVQSILPSILPRWRLRRTAAPFLNASRELIVDCGDGVRLQAFHARPANCNGRAVILLHGWEGSADSYYMVSLGSSLFAAGVEVVRLNLRDHGDTHHLNEGIFHSCRLEEVCGAVAQLGRQLALTEPWLVGFSLGGNFMLRVAASGDPRVGKLGGVVAISPVLHPDNAMVAMEHGWQLYQRYFVYKWSRSLRRKRALWADLIDAGIFRLRDLRGMTAAMVARHTAFTGIGAYLDGYAITGDRLATLAAPAVILASRDDPIIPAADLERLAQHPLLRVVLTERGGHMGFLISPRAGSWVNEFVASELGVTSFST